MGKGLYGHSFVSLPGRIWNFKEISPFKLVLLCSSVRDKRVEEFATNEAIQCSRRSTSSFRSSGNQDYEMPTLQPFKFLHANFELCEAGLVSRAQDYCREVRSSS